MGDHDYVTRLQASRDATRDYYTKSMSKTEQQKLLERLIEASGQSFSTVADIACGGGTLTYHLRLLLPDARFTLVDLNKEAIDLARQLIGADRCSFLCGDLLNLALPDDSFDLVCCWQTLLVLDEPERALSQLVRITKPGGRIYVSSLFNLRHDVDILARIRDYTRWEGPQQFDVSYNTYSAKTTARWLEGKVREHHLHEFVPGVDLVHAGRGIGTYTVGTDLGRLQVSGGYLMNWAVLEIIK